MTAPDPMRVFAFYHLGLDERCEYKFRNLADATAAFGLSSDAFNQLLAALRMDAETIRHVDFNLSKAHADAQMLELLEVPLEEREAFIRDTYKRFVDSLASYRPDQPFEDLDYDNLLGMDD